MSRRKKLPTPTEAAIDNANAVASGRLTREDLVPPVRDNGLTAPVVPPPVLPPPRPVVSLWARRPMPTLAEAKSYPVRCPRCGVSWCTDDPTAITRVVAEHLGQIEGTAARCLQIRRDEGRA